MYRARLLSPYYRDPPASKEHSKGPDVMRQLQLEDEQCTLDLTYRVSSPVSFPLIRLVRFARCYVTYKILAKEPRNSQQSLQVVYSTAQPAIRGV